MNKIWLEARSRISGNLLYIVILAVIFVGALLLRILGPYDAVFTEDGVRFSSTDPWVHMRLVENTIHHLPFRISFDPAALFPYGQNVGVGPFFDVLLAIIIWVIGLGSPTQNTIDTIGAYFPAILGALTVIPVYLIGKEIFNRNAGLLAAALIAILPGEFLARSLLGHTDHHVAEVLFSTVTLLFMILAVKSARKRELSFEHFLNRDWKNIRKPLVYSILAGVMLGVYLLTWIGGILLVLILFSYFMLQYPIDHARGRSTDYLCIIGIPSFFIALLMVIPVSPYFYVVDGKTYLIVSLLAGILMCVALSGASRLMNYIRLERFYYPVALVGLGIVAYLGLRFIIDPSWFSGMQDRLVDIFQPRGAGETVQEARSIFLLDSSETQNVFSWRVVWYNFGSCIIWGTIALIPVAYAAIKQWSAEKTLLVVWSALMIAATIGQVRFAYYLAVNVALLTGYFSWKIVEIVRSVGFKKLPSHLRIGRKAEDIRGTQLPSGRLTKKERKRLRREERRRREEKRYTIGLGRFVRGNLPARYVLGAIIVFLLVLYPPFSMEYEGGSSGFKLPNLDRTWDWDDSLLGRAIRSADVDPGATTGVTDDWYESLIWLGNSTNTPEPYPVDFYYELYERPPEGEHYEYPDAEYEPYGVMSWWDYGHWIMHIARRIPNANPSTHGSAVGRYFVTQNETEGAEILNELGSKYVILDYEMATGKFYAMVNFAGKETSEFFEDYLYYYTTSDGQTMRTAVRLFYPEYYRSMCSRLYNFRGEEVIPENSTWVVTYQMETIGGTRYKAIVDFSEVFPTYDEDAIETYIEGQESINPTWECRVVGVDPFVSPVPLEELSHYKLVHESPSLALSVVPSWYMRWPGCDSRWVEIFEFNYTLAEST